MFTLKAIRHTVQAFVRDSNKGIKWCFSIVMAGRGEAGRREAAPRHISFFLFPSDCSQLHSSGVDPVYLSLRWLMQRCFKQRSHEEAGRAGQSTTKAKSVIYGYWYCWGNKLLAFFVGHPSVSRDSHGQLKEKYTHTHTGMIQVEQ